MTNNKYSNVIQFRRDLHMIPEIGFDLPKTITYIKDYLNELPCTITNIGETSFVAFFDAGKDKTIAFRADMDALPIEENPNRAYRSTHKGKMHACGHDGHMSILLGFASEVAELVQKIDSVSTDSIEEASHQQQLNPDHSNSTTNNSTTNKSEQKSQQLNTNVLLVFQAAEETTGGALEICESGIFEKYNTEKIFGLHIWPGFPRNTIISRKGPFMAGTMNIWITVNGKSSHAAKPEEGIDALDIGTRLVQEIYRMEREEFDKDTRRIVKFGFFNSGHGINVISDKTEFGGTIRFFDIEVRKKILRRIDEISKSLEDEYGCTIDIKDSKGYLPVTNPDELVDELESAINKIKSDPQNADSNINFFPVNEPFLTAEDYSNYQQHLPGLFFFLGTGLDLSLHNENYDIDEAVLPTGVEVFKTLLLNN